MEKNDRSIVTGTLTTDEALEGFRGLGEKYRLILDSYEKAERMLDALASFRRELGYTQRDLADLANIKQPQLARYEKHLEFPRIDTFFRIADALKLNVYLEKKYVPLISFGNLENKTFGISDLNNTYCNIGVNDYGF